MRELAQRMATAQRGAATSAQSASQFADKSAAAVGATEAALRSQEEQELTEARAEQSNQMKLRADDARPLAARRHALACTARPPDEVATACTEGQWWHGLWRVWTRLGDPVRAAAAREAGCAWMVRTQQRHLPAPFHISVRDAVPAHRELLTPLERGAAADWP